MSKVLIYIWLENFLDDLVDMNQSKHEENTGRYP